MKKAKKATRWSHCLNNHPGQYKNCLICNPSIAVQKAMNRFRARLFEINRDIEIKRQTTHERQISPS